MKVKRSVKSSQEWLPLEKVFDDGIFISNHQYIKIIKVLPINYELKSNLEKEAILNSYQTFLKVCDFDIQVLIQSRKENFNSYISIMKNQMLKEKDEGIIQFLNLYIDYIQLKNQTQNSSSKNFYILINSQIESNLEDFNIKTIREELNHKFQKVKDALSRCGNLVFDVTSRKDVEDIMNSFYNFRKSLKFV